MMTVVKEISKEEVNKVKNANVTYDSIKDVFCTLIKTNENDTDFLNSAAFKLYEEKQEKAKVAFDTEKSFIEKNYVPDIVRNNGCSWSLDYNTCIISVVFEDNEESLQALKNEGYIERI